jgi:hypothetical protein
MSPNDHTDRDLGCHPRMTPSRHQNPTCLSPSTPRTQRRAGLDFELRRVAVALAEHSSVRLGALGVLGEKPGPSDVSRKARQERKGEQEAIRSPQSAIRNEQGRSSVLMNLRKSASSADHFGPGGRRRKSISVSGKISQESTKGRECPHSQSGPAVVCGGGHATTAAVIADDVTAVIQPTRPWGLMGPEAS